MADTGGAVLPSGGNFWAVDVFLVFGGNDFSGSGQTKTWRYFFGGNATRRFFSAVGGFSFFGGNVNVNSKIGGNCGA